MRFKDSKAILGFKANQKNKTSRRELELKIPYYLAILIKIFPFKRVRKHRHLVMIDQTLFEIDEYLDRQLVVIEVELRSEDQKIPPASFLGEEVTGREEFKNYNLAR